MEIASKTAAVPKDVTYRGPLIVKSKTRNGPRTIPCKVCGEPYTDIIDPAVDPKKGGYIICPRCLMRGADQVDEENKDIQIDPSELLQAMQDKKLKQYREEHNLTQSELADQMGVTERQYRRIEKEISTEKIIKRIEKRLLRQQKEKQEVT